MIVHAPVALELSLLLVILNVNAQIHAETSPKLSHAPYLEFCRENHKE